MHAYGFNACQPASGCTSIFQIHEKLQNLLFLLLPFPSFQPMVVPSIYSQVELREHPRSSKPHPCSLSQVVPPHLNLLQTQLCFAMQPCYFAVVAKQLREGGRTGFPQPPGWWAHHEVQREPYLEAQLSRKTGERGGEYHRNGTKPPITAYRFTGRDR